MKNLYALLLALIIIGCNTQTETQEKLEALALKEPSYFFPTKRAQVLMVGSFHFDYPGLDEHKTSEDDKIDVLKEPKKSEVTDLVNYIKRFNPNKVVIEARSSWNAGKKFREYRTGLHEDKRDERYQLGMRLARAFQLDTIYSVDASSLQNDLAKKDSILLDSLLEDVVWDAPDPYWDMAKKWFDYNDKLIKEIPLLDYFKYMNSKEYHQYGYGMYLTGSFSTGNGQGADRLSIWWYNRNLRIFSNIINITEDFNDRILVIMGNGHAAVLRQLFESSPQYEWIEFDSL
ncbi:DUF5694 domain-containing protein [Aquimarina gracilis]|uniref:DUF5694 domain-containing protein n=1 Tax=Aquimarina gracilis TaxID=874422 RepID=A0ABU6A1U6_9FLAO|nr:DUF5694 domain-containing protein [Aquimarina gracilis]MEB3348130.1 DUF5694 domain-containing protein [Aquimarina gracilis]